MAHAERAIRREVILLCNGFFVIFYILEMPVAGLFVVLSLFLLSLRLAVASAAQAARVDDIPRLETRDVPSSTATVTLRLELQHGHPGVTVHNKYIVSVHVYRSTSFSTLTWKMTPLFLHSISSVRMNLLMYALTQYRHVEINMQFINIIKFNVIYQRAIA